MTRTAKRLVKYIKIPPIEDDCLLMFAQFPNIPFEIKRVYYILQPKPNLPRGFHAHRQTKQVLFCIQGSIKIILDDGKKRKEVILNKPNIGIFLDSLIWHEMYKLDKNTILLIMASKEYDPLDYIRDYKKFLKIVKKNETDPV